MSDIDREHDIIIGFDTSTVQGALPHYRFQKSHECVACGTRQAELDMVNFRGKWYGRECGCFHDIPGIIQNERG
jgi:hypothetical protein